MSLGDTFRETKYAITANRDREIGIFAIPFLATVFLTAAMYTIEINPSQGAVLSTLGSSGVCSTLAPYAVTSVMGTFQSYPLAHIGMCQVVAFNPMVFAAWYVQMLGLVLLAIFIFEAVFHLG